MTDNNTKPYNSQEAPTKPATDADRIKALEDRIKQLESQMQVLTNRLEAYGEQMQTIMERLKVSEQQMQTIMEALNLPEPEPAEDPARIAARAKYDAAPDDLKYGARLLTRATIFQLVDIAAKAGFPFVYKSELFRIYCDYAKRYNATRLKENILMTAMLREGFPEYHFCGRPCFWISDKPKPRPGKRPKKRPEQ